MIEIILMLYIAYVFNSYFHEIGRGGSNIHIKNFILFKSSNKKYRYGGIIVNFSIAFIIYHIKPELLLLQIVGLMAWKYFIYYSFLGLIKKEVPIQFRSHPVFNEVTRKQAWISIPLIIFSFIIFNEYYCPILKIVWATLIGG